MKLIFAPAARRDLEDIRDYIAQDNPNAAQRVIERVHQVTQQTIKVFPEIGRTWEEGPTRALTIAGLPYRIHYQVQGDTLEILRIHHTKRRPPKL
ncbi:MAG: type II toxin-antitoxin system RelE/ParE family toxin [Pseudomonadota bacterium]